MCGVIAVARSIGPFSAPGAACRPPSRPGSTEAGPPAAGAAARGSAAATERASVPADAWRPPRTRGRRRPAEARRSLSCPLSTMSTNPSGVRPAHCKSSTTNTNGLCGRRPRAGSPPRCVVRAPGPSAGRRGPAGTRSSAANSGVTAAARPALGPSARRMRSRSARNLLLRLGQQQPSQRAKRLMHTVDTPGRDGTGRTCRTRTSRRWPSRSAATRRPARSCPRPPRR